MVNFDGSTIKDLTTKTHLKLEDVEVTDKMVDEIREIAKRLDQ